MKTAKVLLLRIKWLKWYSNIILFYYIIYNTYYGWNKTPASDTELLLDNITTFALFFALGFFISIILYFIVFVMKDYEDNV